MVKCNVLVSIGCGRGLICKNIHRWKNYALCIFSKVIKKLKVKKKRKTSDWAFLKNARLDVFGFFITHHFLITFEKIHKAYFFQHSRFLAYSTLTQFSVKCFIIFFQHSWKMLFQPFADFLHKNTHMSSNSIFSRPGRSQGLIYKHLCNSLSNSLVDPLWKNLYSTVTS